MSTRKLRITNDGPIHQVLSLARTYADPRTLPAISLMLGYYISLRQLQKIRWQDIDLRAYTVLIRDASGVSVRTLQLTGLMVQQLGPIVRRKSRSARPFGKASTDAPTMSRLLRSVLMRAGLVNCTPADLAAWSFSKSEAVRASVVTACTY